MSIFHSKKTAVVLVSLFMIIIIAFFAVSLFSKDKAVSTTENRALTQRPAFSVSAVFDGSYTTDFESYFSDQFPGRDTFLEINKKIKKITSQFAVGDDSVVSYNKSSKDDFGGQSLDDVK